MHSVSRIPGMAWVPMRIRTGMDPQLLKLLDPDPGVESERTIYF